MRLSLGRAALCLLSTSLPAASLGAQEVRYELRIADLDKSLGSVTATFPTQGKDTVELFLPVWSPGFYRIENYHEQVTDFAARDIAGKLLEVTQPRPNRWRIATQGATAVVASYTLMCKRASVTHNQITPRFAVFCGPATLVGEVGAAPRAHSVQVALPVGWQVSACGLPAAGDGRAHHYIARDYDWLLDSPIVLGDIATTTFDVLGARHEWAQFGDAGAWDTKLLVKNLQPIATELCSTFGVVPFDRYVFLAGFRHANGGLEHLASTLISVNQRQRPDDPGFLSFVAHEYAHAFNVKRLRPRELGPFDYENPPSTPSLWISEGLTTWYGDLALARSGTLTATAWLGMVSGHIRGLQGSPGRRRQTLADASLSVWTGSMSGTGGDPRLTISYYVKGPVVGFVLEARMRVATAGKFGLDEVMRRAYARYSGAEGFQPEQFEAIAAEVAGSSQQAFFDRALRSTDELDYGEALAWYGLRFHAVEAEAPREQRWMLEVAESANAEQREHLRVLLAPTPVPSSPVPLTK